VAMHHFEHLMLFGRRKLTPEQRTEGHHNGDAGTGRKQYEKPKFLVRIQKNAPERMGRENASTGTGRVPVDGGRAVNHKFTAFLLSSVS